MVREPGPTEVAMAVDALVTYMNDHLAGSRSALDLLEALIKSTSDAKTREFLDVVRAEIAADRDVLEQLIRRVGSGPSVVREVGGWIAEKIARLKLVIDDPSNGPLRRFEALELLALGIQGKSALWRALSLAAPAVPELTGVNFGNLIRRAEDQYARVEDQRVAAARVALMTGRDVPAAPHAASKG
jgi:hypothetical protein